MIYLVTRHSLLNYSDVDEVVPLIYSSGPDAFSFVFTSNKTSAIEFLNYAFQQEGGEFSYDNHYALLVHGKIVGAGSVFDSKRAKGFAIRDGFNILKYYGIKSLPVLINGLNTEKVIKVPLGNEICIGHLGITSDFRGKGLGSKLVEFLMKESKAQPTDVFVLDVSEENPRAKALYDRMGFEVRKHEISTLKNSHGHVPNHFRMELEVNKQPI